MNRTKNIFYIVLLLFFYVPLFGQAVEWNTGFNGFFDNREYFNSYVAPQTMFGSRAFVSGGIAINKNHRVIGGIDILQEFGDHISLDDIQPIMYYQYKNQFIDVLMGSFPRHNRITSPDIFLYDTLQYYRPNNDGIFLEARQSWGFQNAWIDWTSRQTEDNREIFQIGGTGKIKKGLLFYQHDFIMTHRAGPAIRIPDDHIRDNGGAFAGIGIQTSNTFLDSLSVGTGYSYSYDRLRDVYDSTHHGSLSHLYIELFGFGIRTSHYFGTGQVLYGGDGLYKSPHYQRIDLIWHVFRNKQVQGKIEFTFHIVGDILDMSQRFTIFANFGGAQTLRKQ